MVVAERVSLSSSECVMAVGEYREMMNDYGSTDVQIMLRLEYLESFCRDIIRFELNRYVESIHNKKESHR